MKPNSVYMLDEISISPKHRVNIGLHYELPSLYIIANDKKFVYITKEDWPIIVGNISVIETYVKDGKLPAVSYSDNIIYAYNIIVYMNEGEISFVNTCLNNNVITVDCITIRGLKRLFPYIESHLYQLHDVHKTMCSYYVRGRSVRKKVKEMYTRLNKKLL